MTRRNHLSADMEKQSDEWLHRSLVFSMSVALTDVLSHEIDMFSVTHSDQQELKKIRV